MRTRFEFPVEVIVEDTEDFYTKRVTVYTDAGNCSGFPDFEGYVHAGDHKDAAKRAMIMVSATNGLLCTVVDERLRDASKVVKEHFHWVNHREPNRNVETRPG